MSAEPNSPEGEKLDVMVTRIEAYRFERHFPLTYLIRYKAIKFDMESKGLTAKT